MSTRWSETRLERWFGALAFLVLVLFSACARRAAKAPHILVITVGALRPDELGCYGSTQGLTPAIDALAARGARFDAAYATAPCSVPSVASLWTARLPSEVHLERVDEQLAPEAKTLAEVLRSQGFEAYAVVGDYRLGPSRGLDRGFQAFTCADTRDPEGDTTTLVFDSLRAFLSIAAGGEEPCLMYAHLSELEPSRQRLAHEVSDVERVANGLEIDDLELDRTGYRTDLKRIDSAVDLVMKELERRKLADHTLVVFAGTYGYQWGARSWGESSYELAEDLVHVPLILAGPGVTPRSVQTPVSIAALAPTLLELAGLDGKALGSNTKSLLPLLRGDAELESTAVACEVDYVPKLQGVRDHAVQARAVRLDRWKLVVDRERGTQLFDLAGDLADQQDLAREQPSELERMRGVFDATFSAPPN